MFTSAFELALMLPAFPRHLARAVIIALAVFTFSAFGQVYTEWTGSGTNWSDGSNWTNGRPSDVYGQLEFKGNGNATSNNDQGNVSQWRMYFTGTKSYTLTSSGGVVNLMDFGDAFSWLLSDSTVTQTFSSLDVNFAATKGNNWGQISARSSGDFVFNNIGITGSIVADLRITAQSTGKVIVNGAISGSGKNVVIGLREDGTTVDSSAQVNFAGVNTYTGATTIRGGTLSLTGGGSLANGISGTRVNVASGGTFNISGVTSGASVSILSERGASDGGSAKLGSKALTMNGGTSGTTYFFNNLGISGDTGSFTLNSSGVTLSLYGSSLYTGATTLSAGTLTTSSSMASSGYTLSGGNLNTTTSADLSDTATVAISSGTFTVGATDTIGAISGTAGTISIGTGITLTSSSASTTTFAGIISGAAGNFTKGGVGTLTLSNANTFSGTTSITGGTLTLGNSLALQNSTLNYTVSNGGALSFGTLTAATLGGLSGDKALALTNATLTSVALTVGGNNADTTYTGALSGGGSLFKTGTGALTLNNSSNYSGGTTLSSGTLNINNATAIGSGNLTVNAAATFDNASANAITLTNSNSLVLTGNSSGTNSTVTFGGTKDLTFRGGLTLNNAAKTLVVSGSTLTFTGGIAADNSGARNLSKTGSGTLVLNGAAGTYTGTTAIIAGSLGIGNNTALGSGGLELGGTNGNTPTIYASGAARIITNNVTLLATSVNGNPTIAGSNDVTINGTLTNSGANRTLTINNSGMTSFGSNVYLSEITGTGRTLNINGSGKALITGAISNANGSGTAGSLTYSGTGKLTLSGSNSFSGALTISSGVVQLGNNTTIGDAGNANISMAANTTLAFNRSDATPTFSNAINLTGTNSGQANAGFFNVATNTVATLNGAITTSGEEFWKSGAGTLIVNRAANSFNTSVVIQAGVLEADSLSNGNSNSSLGKGGIFIGQGGSGTLRYSGGTATTDRIGSFALQGATLNGVDVSNGATNLTVSSVIGEAGGSRALTKLGAGTLILTNNNTYTGGTFISAGTLLVNNTTGSGTGSGALTVGNSGTLGGTGAINAGNNGITINGLVSSGSASSAGNTGTITLHGGTGALTLGSTSLLLFDILSSSNSTNKDLVALTSSSLSLQGGALQLNLGGTFTYANTYTLFSGVSSETGSFGTVTGYDTTNYMAVFALNGTNYDISFTPVPEPSTWATAALAAAFIGYSFSVKRRKRLQKREGRIVECGMTAS